MYCKKKQEFNRISNMLNVYTIYYKSFIILMCYLITNLIDVNK